MKRRDRYDYDRYTPPRSKPVETNNNPFSVAKTAILASVFVLGIVVGIALNFGDSSNPASIDSRLEIDRQAPNPELCQQFGASAIVSDMRFFLTLNPLSVFVTQPVVQPGCVLRQNNWSILEKQKLITSEQVRDCKRRMNTFGFIGDLGNSPKIECVYQNDSAGNLFLNKLGNNGTRPELENF